MGRNTKTGRATVEKEIESAMVKQGKRNTSFFHKSTIQNRDFNRTLSLKNADGDQVFSRDHIGSELNSYFTSLLSEPLQY